MVDSIVLVWYAEELQEHRLFFWEKPCRFSSGIIYVHDAKHRLCFWKNPVFSAVVSYVHDAQLCSAVHSCASLRGLVRRLPKSGVAKTPPPPLHPRDKHVTPWPSCLPNDPSSLSHPPPLCRPSRDFLNPGSRRLSSPTAAASSRTKCAIHFCNAGKP